MKRSYLATAGALALAIVAILLWLPQSAQVDGSFVAQVDAATAARFVTLHPEQNENFFAEQTDAKFAYCVSKEALVAFRQFEKTMSAGKNSLWSETLKEGQVKPLRISSLKEAGFDKGIVDPGTAQDGAMENGMEPAKETPLEAIDREIKELEATISTMPADAESALKDHHEQLLQARAKLEAKQ